jgi:hypothetical protein
MTNAALGGCFGSKAKDNGSKDVQLDASSSTVVPVLTLQVKVGNDTFSYSSAPKVGNLTPSPPSHGNGTSNATSSTSSNSTTTGNATGNSTNATAIPAAPTSPTGLAPLNVTFLVSVANTTGKLNWTFSNGDSAPAAVAPSGNTTGNSTGNATSASSSSTSASNATAKSAPAGITAGNTTNATLTHSYGLAGNYTATFTLTLANLSKISVTAPITVTALGSASNATSGVPPGTVLGPVEPLSHDGTTGTQVQDPLGLTDCVKASDNEWVFQAKDANGTAMKVTNVTINLTGSTTNRDSDIYFYDPAGNELGKGTGSSATETITVAGPLDPGTYKVSVYICTGVAGTYKLTGAGTYVAA